MMGKRLIRFLSKMHRGVLICGGFALFMLLGAFLLMLPFRRPAGRRFLLWMLFHVGEHGECHGHEYV